MVCWKVSLVVAVSGVLESFPGCSSSGVLESFPGCCRSGVLERFTGSSS